MVKKLISMIKNIRKYSREQTKNIDMRTKIIGQGTYNRTKVKKDYQEEIKKEYMLEELEPRMDRF